MDASSARRAVQWAQWAHPRGRVSRSTSSCASSSESDVAGAGVGTVCRKV